MASVLGAFKPSTGAATVNITAATSSARVAVRAARDSVSPNVRVYNAGSVIAFIENGGSGVTAAVATGIPIAPGAVEVICLPSTHIAAITGSSTAVLYLTPGSGV